MKKLFIMTSIVVAFAFASVSATIINVPDDYGTIQQGINASSDGDTVLVQPDTYVENINFNGHNIVLGSLFLTTGDTSYISSTIIDGDSSGTVVTFENGESSVSKICGFSITNGSNGGIKCLWSSNPIIEFNYIRFNVGQSSIDIAAYSNPQIKFNCISNNSNPWGGGGIEITNNSNPLIAQNRIYDNTAGVWGGGIYIDYNSDPLITNNFIYRNIANVGGGLNCRQNSHPLIINNVIFGNYATAYGGGLWCQNSQPILVNNIFWSDSIPYGPENGPEIYGHFPVINYCDIQDSVWEGEGNIDIDPLFRDPDNGDFHLTWANFPVEDSTKSPCIDSGDPQSPIDPDGTRADIGAFYFDQSQSDIMNYVPIPDQFYLGQNYPNPFNPTTTISFAIEYPQLVTLKIYDLLGREVQTLIDEQRQAGMHTVRFDASHLSSGIYFYRLQAGDYSESKRMVLLK